MVLFNMSLTIPFRYHTNPHDFPQAERTVRAPWSIQSQGSHLPTSDSPDQSRAIRCSVAGDRCINRCCPVKCWYTSWSSTFKRVSSIWWHYPVESSPFGFFKKNKRGGNGNAWPPWIHIAWKLMVGRPSFPFPFKMVPLKKGHLLIFGGAIVDIKFSGINLKLDSNSNVIQLFKCMKLVTRPWNSLSLYIYIYWFHVPHLSIITPKLTNRFVFRVGFFGGLDLLSCFWGGLEDQCTGQNADWNCKELHTQPMHLGTFPRSVFLSLISFCTKGQERNCWWRIFFFGDLCFWGWLMYVFVFLSDSKR